MNEELFFFSHFFQSFNFICIYKLTHYKVEKQLFRFKKGFCRRASEIRGVFGEEDREDCWVKPLKPFNKRSYRIAKDLCPRKNGTRGPYFSNKLPA
jgi:hypothetical protein